MTTDPNAFPELIFDPPRLDVVGDLRDVPEDAPTRATYVEDDWIAEVEILKDLGDQDHEAYRLRVVRTIGPSQIYRPVPDGNEFLCDQRRGPLNRIFILTR